MQTATSSQPLTTSNILPNDQNATFTNPLASISSIKYEPTIPASLTNIQPSPVVPAPGQQQPTYLVGPSSIVSPTQTLPTMQVLQTTTINPNGMTNEIQPYQAHIPQPSQQHQPQQVQDIKEIQQIASNPPLSIVTTNGWNQEIPKNILTENVVQA